MLAALLFAVGQISERMAASASVSGWQAGPEEVYAADTLHTYIDGASEVYRALNVQRVVTCRYKREGQPDILLDVFEMRTDADAFGAYHHDVREGEEVHIGCDSEYEGSSLAFWKGRFVVYVTALRPGEEVREATLALGRQVAAGIAEEGEPPALLRMLPEAGLQRGWIRYFHNHMSLNLYFSLSEENVLNLGPETEGVLARYKTATGGRLTCLVLTYPTGEAASAACENFLTRYLAGKPEGNAGTAKGGRWAGARASGCVVAVVLDAPERRDVDEKLEQVLRAVNKEVVGHE